MSETSETDIWYRLLFEATPLAMLIYDRQSFSVLDANRTALEQYGYSRSEWLKMSLTDLHPASDLAAVSNELAAMRTHPLPARAFGANCARMDGDFRQYRALPDSLSRKKRGHCHRP